VEAHEEIGRTMALEGRSGLRAQVRGDGIVDIEQRRGERGRADGHVFAQGAVDVHLAGYGHSARGEAGIDVAGDEAEVLLEGWPALVGHDAVGAGSQVAFHEASQGQFVLGELGQEIRVGIGGAQFLGHVVGDGRDRTLSLGL
jgi:hypothetical protein